MSSCRVMIAGEIWVHFGMFWVYNTRIAGGFDMFRFAPPPVSFSVLKYIKIYGLSLRISVFGLGVMNSE